MNIERISISAVVLDPANARKHGAKNLEAIKGSLARFGQQKPIVLGKNGVVIAGNGTVTAARELGWDEIDAVRTDLEGTDATAFALADNRTSELAEWDSEVLTRTLRALDELDFDLASIGFDDFDLTLPPAEGLTDPDEIPENVETRCKPGDLWTLGDHRILCGDSTNVQHVERLMGGEKASLCFTSPPYGQQRDYGVGKVSDWDELMNGVFSIVPLASDGQLLVNLGMVHRENEWLPYWEKWLEYMRAAGWRRFGLYVWDQGPGLPGNWNGRLAPSFELVFHFNKEARQASKWVEKKPESVREKTGSGLRKADGTMSGVSSPLAGLQPTKIPDNVVRINRQGTERLGHPAAFPCAFPEFMANTYSAPGQSLFEPFLGSGSTLIACEKTGRRCFGMELDPKYCDGILSRWEKFAGKTASLSAAEETV